MRRRRPAVAVLGAAALVLAACGGSDDASDPSTAGDDPAVEVESGSDDPDADLTDDVITDTGNANARLDEGQLDILDDVADGFEDEFGDDEMGDVAPGTGATIQARRTTTLPTL